MIDDEPKNPLSSPFNDSTHIPLSLRKKNDDDNYQGRELSEAESKEQTRIEEFMRRLEQKAKSRTAHERVRTR